MGALGYAVIVERDFFRYILPGLSKGVQVGVHPRAGGRGRQGRGAVAQPDFFSVVCFRCSGGGRSRIPMLQESRSAGGRILVPVCAEVRGCAGRCGGERGAHFGKRLLARVLQKVMER